MAVDCSQAILDVMPALNAGQGAFDLLFWTTDELYRWMDEAAQRLARTAGVFVVRDTSLVTVQGVATANLPANQVSTIQVDLAGKVLRPRTIHELEALDSGWTTAAQAPPNSFVQEGQGVNTITIYPPPDAANSGKRVGIVMHVTPPTITAGLPVLQSAPTAVREYFTLYALGEARAAETKAAMPEVAGWLRQLTGMMEQVIEGYWGEAQ